MKILFVTSIYPSDKESVAGIFIHQQAKALKKLGVDVDVLLVDVRSIRKRRTIGFSEYIYGQIKVYRYSLPCGPLPYILDRAIKVALNRGFEKYVKEEGMPDGLHIHFGVSCGYAVQIGKKYNIPVCITEHSSILMKKMSSKIIKNVKQAYELADELIAVSSSLKKNMQKITKREVSVIGNMVNSCFMVGPTFDEKNKFIFISVGALISSKRFDLTLAAFSDICKKHSNVFLEIVGDGILKRELKQLVQELGIADKVQFYGQVENEKISELYSSANCFVLPSDYETFGVVYIEAAASGLPLIATKCGGPEDIVEESNGVLVEKNNVWALKEAMEKVIENRDKFNPKEISTNIRRKFGEDAVGMQIISVYDRMLKTKRIKSIDNE